MKTNLFKKLVYALFSLLLFGATLNYGMDPSTAKLTAFVLLGAGAGYALFGNPLPNGVFASVTTPFGHTVGELKDSTTPGEHKARDIHPDMILTDNRQFAFDTILHHLKKPRTVKSMVYEWATKMQSDRFVNVIGAGFAAGAGVRAAVTGTIDRADKLIVDAIVSVRDSTGKLDIAHPYPYLVTAVNTSAGTVSLVQVTPSGYGTVIAVPAGKILHLDHVVKAECASPSRALHLAPQYTRNYLQEFDRVAEYSQWKKETENNTNKHDIMIEKQRILEELRRDRANANYKGIPAADVDLNTGELKYFMGGIDYFVPSGNTFAYTLGSLTLANMQGLAMDMGTGNNGSFKTLFVGGKYVVADMQMILEPYLQTNQSETVGGLILNRYKTMFKEFTIAYDPTLDDLGMPHVGYGLDMKFIVPTEIKALDHVVRTPKEIGKKCYQDWYSHICGIEIHNPDAHYRIVGA